MRIPSVLRAGVPRVPQIFCPTPAAERIARTVPPLAVVRGPCGFGKTSTVAYWLRSAAWADHAAAWITLRTQTTPAQLWETLHAGLTGVGIPHMGSQVDLPALEARLAGAARRLVVVIDGLQHVADQQVDVALVDLVQRHHMFHLVVTSRVERPMSALGPATVDAAVLELPDLLLSPTEAGELATAFGVAGTAEEITSIVTDHGGWPALVRTALLHTRPDAAGRLVTDQAGVTRYLGLVLQDPEHAGWRDAVVTLALPDPLRPGDPEVLLPDQADQQSAHAVLSRAAAVDGAHQPGVYPGGLRLALVEYLRESQPHRYRELNELLCTQRRTQGHPVEALTYGIRAEAWPLVQGVLEENWAELLRRNVDLVRAAVQAMPAHLVDSSVPLVVARDHVLDKDVPVQAEAALRGGLLVPGADLQTPSLTITQRLGLRSVRPYLAPASSESDAPAAPADPGANGVQAPELLTVWALSMLYDNDGIGAAYGFTLACQEARRVIDPRAAREAAHGAALSLALLGHIGPARDWHTYATTFAADPSALELIAGPLTLGFIGELALTHGHGPAAEAAPEPAAWPPAEPAAVEPGLAPLDEFSRLTAAYCNLMRGCVDRAQVDLQRHLTTGSSAPEPAVRESAASLQVDLVLAQGRMDHAGALLEQGLHSGAWILTARARHAFYVGDFQRTIRITRDASDYAGARPLVGLELLLLQACAHWRLRDSGPATDHLATAIAIAQDTGVLLPFRTVPRADLEAMAPPGTWVREFLDQPALAEREAIFPEPLRAGELSAAELQVLRELSLGAPLALIARRLFVAESTVKSHLRQIYRKLGASTRDQAVQRAQDFSLLGEAEGEAAHPLRNHPAITLELSDRTGASSGGLGLV